ncbi:MAG: hypothetical protein IPO81_10100 [Kouleothrix sp.]|nr:hypothetical protein [Kouleothrix sp.]
MRISPNQPRLRVVALACWAIGGWCLIDGGRLVGAGAAITALLISVDLLGLLLFAIGLTFWLLSNDRRAGIIFDSKGLLLNLGHSAAFITWENIERLGVTSHRASLLALGSRRQLGIALCDAEAYIQTYEERLPAASGPIARSLGWIERGLRPFRRRNSRPIAAQMAFFRAKTGYDVLIPEALLGGKADAFVDLVETYRQHPIDRHALDGTIWMR